MEGGRYARDDLSTGQKLVESWKRKATLALAARMQRAGRGAQVSKERLWAGCSSVEQTAV